MRNTLLIARREYLERIHSKAFAVMTVLVPLIMAGFTVVPTMMATRMQGKAKHLVIVASDQRTSELIREELASNKQRQRDEESETEKTTVPKRGAPQASARFIIDIDTDTSDAEHSALTEKIKQNQIDGFIWATNDALAQKKITFTTRDVASLIDNENIRQSVVEAAQRNTLRSKGMNDKEIEQLQEPVHLRIQGTASAGPTNVQQTFLTVVFLLTILYVTVLLYGINVMNAVIEEKNSRVMEVMLASSEPKALMAGKVIGVGAVGLTQIGIWVLAGVLLANGLFAGSAQLKELISLKVALFFPVFFVLGYAFYSALYAAVGATVNTQQEGQQLQQLIALPLALAFVFIFTIINYPNSPLAIA